MGSLFWSLFPLAFSFLLLYLPQKAAVVTAEVTEGAMAVATLAAGAIPLVTPSVIP